MLQHRPHLVNIPRGLGSLGVDDRKPVMRLNAIRWGLASWASVCGTLSWLAGYTCRCRALPSSVPEQMWSSCSEYITSTDPPSLEDRVGYCSIIVNTRNRTKSCVKPKSTVIQIDCASPTTHPLSNPALACRAPCLSTDVFVAQPIAASHYTYLANERVSPPATHHVG